jgi:hypothetical protein
MVRQHARAMLDGARRRAITAISSVENWQAKSLLRKILGRILGEFEHLGCCEEYNNNDD